MRMTAEADVDAVLRWFHGQRATAAGTRWFWRLVDRLNTLERRPERCAVASESEELDIEIRELLFGKRDGVYRILFKIDNRTVLIDTRGLASAVS